MASPAGADRTAEAQNDGKSDQTTRRRESFASQESQTAKEYEAIRASLSMRSVALLTYLYSFIESQLQLEADAREILPYVSRSRFQININKYL